MLFDFVSFVCLFCFLKNKIVVVLNDFGIKFNYIWSSLPILHLTTPSPLPCPYEEVDVGLQCSHGGDAVDNQSPVGVAPVVAVWRGARHLPVTRQPLSVEREVVVDVGYVPKPTCNAKRMLFNDTLNTFC